MQDVLTENAVPPQETANTSPAALARLSIGLLQGLILYGLFEAARANLWPVVGPYLFTPLILISTIVPVLLISALGHLDARRLGAWMLAALVIVAALGIYDAWRSAIGLSSFGESKGMSRFPSFVLSVFLVVGFFIAHSLVVAACKDKRRIADYATHFDIAWKLMVQLLFSAIFVGVLWGALALGAALFMLVGLDFLKQLLQRSWFAIPATTLAISWALHITDMRPAIVRGIRSLLLVLLSWILPLTTLLVVGFLLSLPWTGLQPLWATRKATAVLLGATALLVILINAAYQDGRIAGGVARVVRGSVRLAALSLVPMTAIAVYSLGLRVTEYGWTVDRIIAAACLVIATAYALGYGWAACRRTAWMPALAPVNVTTAYLILAVLLALFSPLADPARLSVNHQVGRLLAGKISAEKFDFQYLKFEGARYGAAALEKLKHHAQGPDAPVIRENAQRAMEMKYRSPMPIPAPRSVDLAANITAWPKQAPLPASFFRQDWQAGNRPWAIPMCLTHPDKRCDAFQLDLTGDGKPEILLIGTERHVGSAVMMEESGETWTPLGSLPHDVPGCEPLRQQFIAGNFVAAVSPLRDLEVAGQRIEIVRDRLPVSACPPHERK